MDSNPAKSTSALLFVFALDCCYSSKLERCSLTVKYANDAIAQSYGVDPVMWVQSPVGHLFSYTLFPQEANGLHPWTSLKTKRERGRGTVLDAEAKEWLCGASALDGEFKG